MYTFGNPEYGQLGESELSFMSLFNMIILFCMMFVLVANLRTHALKSIIKAFFSHKNRMVENEQLADRRPVCQSMVYWLARHR